MKKFILLIIIASHTLTAQIFNSNEYDSLLNIAAKYEEDFNFRNAIELYNKIISKNSKDAEIYLHLGDCYLKVYEYKKAVSNFRKYLNLKNSKSVNVKLIDALIKSDSIQKAKYELKKILRNENSGYLFYKMARINVLENGIEDAKYYLKKSLEVDSTNIIAYQLLSNIYLNQSELDSSKIWAQKGLMIKNGARKLLRNLSIISFKEKDYLNSIFYHNKLISKNDTTFEVVNRLGISYCQASNGKNKNVEMLKLEEALKYLKWANRIKNDDPVNNYYLGLVYKNLDSLELSLNYMQNAIKLAIPDYIGSINFEIAKIYDSKNDYKNAIKWMNKALYYDKLKEYYYYKAILYDKYYYNTLQILRILDS